MAIAAVGGQGGVTVGTGGNVSRAFGSNVSVGSLITVIAWAYKPTNDPWVAGDCTKSAGTATIDTPTLDASIIVNLTANGVDYNDVAIWSCLVTGAGSLTMQVACGGGEFACIATHEFTGTFDSGRVEDFSTNSTATVNQNPGHSGDATAAGDALFIGGLGVGQAGVSLTITPDGAFTQIGENEAGGTSQVGSAIYRLVTGGATDRAEWTLPTTNNQGYGAAVAVYKEAGAGPPVITDQPDDITRYSGQTASFTVAATGTGTLTYQWQRSTNSGGSWSNVSGGSGATSTTYTTDALGFVENGYLYRCVVTDDNGSTNSNGARLTLISAASLSWFRA